MTVWKVFLRFIRINISKYLFFFCISVTLRISVRYSKLSFSNVNKRYLIHRHLLLDATR